MSTSTNERKLDRQRSIILGVLIGATPALMALVPWDFGTEMSNYRALMLGLSLIIPIIEIAVIFWALKLKIELTGSISTFPATEKIALAILVSIAMFTALFVAAYPTRALIGLHIWLIHIFFGLALYHMIGTKKLINVNAIWVGVSVGLLAYLLILAIFMATVTNPEEYDWVVGFPGVPNIRSTGFFSVAGFAAGAAVSFGSPRRYQFFLGLVFASSALGLAVWSATRGALFGIAMAIAFLLICRSDYRSRKFAGWVLGVVVIGVLFSSILYKPNNQFGLARLFNSIENTEGSLDRLSAGRITMWKETVPLISKRPVLGYGELQYKIAGPKSTRGLNQPHNIFLQIAFQWGLVGAVLFFVLLTRFGWFVWCRTSYGKNMGIGELILIVSVLVYSLYDAALFYPYPIMMFTLAVAIAFASTNQPAPADDRSD